MIAYCAGVAVSATAVMAVWVATGGCAVPTAGLAANTVIALSIISIAAEMIARAFFFIIFPS